MTTEEKLQAARAALGLIAERGIVHVSGVAKLFGTCRVCRHTQEFSGRCANRECLTSIADNALRETA